MLRDGVIFIERAIAVEGKLFPVHAIPEWPQEAADGMVAEIAGDKADAQRPFRILAALPRQRQVEFFRPSAYQLAIGKMALKEHLRRDGKIVGQNKQQAGEAVKIARRKLKRFFEEIACFR